MSSTSFSLTERFIVNPILHMRAELVYDPESPHGVGGEVWHFIEAEVFARVTALATSVLAASDAWVHLFNGCYKGSGLLIGKCCSIQTSYSQAEVNAHFKGAAFFAGVALVGSVAGFVWPGLVKYFKHSSLDPLEYADNRSHEVQEAVFALAVRVENKEELAPFNKLQEFWSGSNLASKHKFVQTFNNDNSGFEAVREALARVVYRPIGETALSGRQVKWLNETEVSNNVPRKYWERVNAFTNGFFFHATSEEALESILKGGKVEVRHEKAYRGAFVSTQPEVAFGRCVLAFNRHIERLSPLAHGFTSVQNVYWAGFSRDIPVNDETLAYIILDSRSELERNQLAIQCNQWGGRKIEVVLKDDVEEKLKAIKRLDMGIPQEWPEDGGAAGANIIRAMKLALRVPNQPVVNQKSNEKNKKLMMVACG